MFGQRDDTNNDSQNQDGAPALPQAPFIGPPPTGTVLPTETDPITPMTEPQSQTDPVTPLHTPSIVQADTTNDVTGSDDLARMKQEALQHLQPLVDTLQQSPEEEFKTIMMMIQATDDKTLLKKALEAAKKIADDKVRAQAMLDVINEINYFTQSSERD
ncbi:hypothetical protein EB118_07455 [bacterium]|nr:hypothetical protein [bacterium]NDC94647.1 hypothetical protein [bacterium]NDD84269.1 hypothetical protein [bacterium]NDG29917.1 hypothetical protein [bacterium]